MQGLSCKLGFKTKKMKGEALRYCPLTFKNKYEIIKLPFSHTWAPVQTRAAPLRYFFY